MTALNFLGYASTTLSVFWIGFFCCTKADRETLEITQRAWLVRLRARYDYRHVLALLAALYVLAATPLWVISMSRADHAAAQAPQHTLRATR